MADKSKSDIMTNGDVTTTNGHLDVNDVQAKSKVVEYETQSADVTESSARSEKFSSKLTEGAGEEGGNKYREKEYHEAAQRSAQERDGDTQLGSSFSQQLAEKERVSETSGGGVKSEYTAGSDEQYKSQARTVSKVGDADVETHKSTSSSYTKACSKIDEQLPGNSVGSGGSAAAATAGAVVGCAGVGRGEGGGTAGRRVTEASRGDYSHSENVSSSVTRPDGGTTRTQGTVDETKSDSIVSTSVSSPTGAALHITSTKHHRAHAYSMESSTASGGASAGLEEGVSPGAAGAAAEGSTLDDTNPEQTGPKEIKLSTKISSEDGKSFNAAGSSLSKQEVVSESSKFKSEHVSVKESSEVTGAATYSRAQQPDATPSDNMSVSSMSSAHDLNDIKMSSASSSECAFNSTKMETGEMDRAKDFKYNRKSTDNLVKRILGESDTDRKNRYKINMGDNEDEEEVDRDSLLQRRLASLDKGGTGRRTTNGSGLSQTGNEYMMEEFEREETSYRKSRTGRLNRQGSGDLDSPRARRLGRPGSRGSFDYDDYDDYEDSGYGGGGHGRGYAGRGRFARQNYIDDDDVFGAPIQQFQPLFRDEEFEPQKRDETEDYVKEKTASIRGMVDRQTVVLENLRKASESFDELTDEIKNIRQAFIENQARRSMLFAPGEGPLDDEQSHDTPRGPAGAGSRARSRYVQQREEDYEFAMKDAARVRKSQYARAGEEDYGLEQGPGSRGRQKQFALEDGKDDYGLSGYGRSRMSRDFDDGGPKSLGAQDDYLSSYGRSRGLDKNSEDSLYQPKSQAGKALIKKSSYYSAQEDYSTTYNAGADAYNRRMRGLGGRSKSLYDEASGGEKDGWTLEDGGGVGAGGRRGRIGLQRTQYDPLSDDASTPGVKDRYGSVSAYGSGVGGSSGTGYTRVGDPLSATSSYGSSATSAAATQRSSYLTSSTASSAASRLASAASTSSTSSARPKFSRSRTLSDIDFDSSPRGGGSAQGDGFTSRFLGKVRQRSMAGEDVTRAGKPFKSRFLRSSFDFGDGEEGATSASSSSSYSSKRKTESSSVTSTTAATESKDE